MHWEIWKGHQNDCIVWVPVLCWKGLTRGSLVCVVRPHRSRPSKPRHTFTSVHKQSGVLQVFATGRWSSIIYKIFIPKCDIFFWKMLPPENHPSIFQKHRLFPQIQNYFVSKMLRWRIIVILLFSYQRGLCINSFSFSDSSFSFFSQALHLLNSCPVFVLFFGLQVFPFQHNVPLVETVISNIWWVNICEPHDVNQTGLCNACFSAVSCLKRWLYV